MDFEKLPYYLAGIVLLVFVIFIFVAPRHAVQPKMPISCEGIDVSDPSKIAGMHSQFETCTCPEGKVKDANALIARCVTESLTSCNSNADCPQGEECKSGEGSDAFRCTGRLYGCWTYPGRTNVNGQAIATCVD